MKNWERRGALPRRLLAGLLPTFAALALILGLPLPSRGADPVSLPSGHIELPKGEDAADEAVKRQPGSHPRSRLMALMMAAKDEEVQDFTNLSLEQLMSVKLTTINVLGGHTHLKNQMMVSYQYMLMDMGGYGDGAHGLSNAQVLKQFPTIHTGMTMEMHMLELMYAPSDDLTLMAMFPWKIMGMEHLTRAGLKFPTSSEGFGDIQLMALYTFAGNQRKGGNRFIFNGGISIPTGGINQRDFVPGKGVIKLEYPMQLGSGTVDLMPGITYLGDSTHWAWGAQALGNIRLGTNDNGYKFGNQLHLTTWGVYRLKDWVAPSVRLQSSIISDVHGFDPEINPLGTPESNPKLQGGRRVDLLFGMHFYAPKGTLKNTRLTIEGGFPIYQSLNGPQLQSNWQFSLGLSRVF